MLTQTDYWTAKCPTHAAHLVLWDCFQRPLQGAETGALHGLNHYSEDSKPSMVDCRPFLFPFLPYWHSTLHRTLDLNGNEGILVGQCQESRTVSVQTWAFLSWFIQQGLGFGLPQASSKRSSMKALLLPPDNSRLAPLYPRKFYGGKGKRLERAVVLKTEAAPDSKDDKLKREAPPLEGCGPTAGATAWLRRRVCRSRCSGVSISVPNFPLTWQFLMMHNLSGYPGKQPRGSETQRAQWLSIQWIRTRGPLQCKCAESEGMRGFWS